MGRMAASVRNAPNTGLDERPRCGWSTTEPLYVRYHDTEWGVQLHDDRKLYEFLVLEGFQAGLSWFTVLRKRENFREAFDGFDPDAVSRYGKRDVARLMKNSGIIRNRSKILAAIQNASSFLMVVDEFGSFDSYIWSFVDGKQKVNSWRRLSDLPASTAESALMSADLSRRGFRFAGPTICYAHMQATGMVNDHLVTCFRHSECL